MHGDPGALEVERLSQLPCLDRPGGTIPTVSDMADEFAIVREADFALLDMRLGSLVHVGQVRDVVVRQDGRPTLVAADAIMA